MATNETGAENQSAPTPPVPPTAAPEAPSAPQAAPAPAVPPVALQPATAPAEGVAAPPPVHPSAVDNSGATVPTGIGAPDVPQQPVMPAQPPMTQPMVGQTAAQPGAAEPAPLGAGPVSPNIGQYQGQHATPDGYVQTGPQPEMASAVGPDGQMMPPVAPVNQMQAAVPAQPQVPMDPNARTIWIYVNRNQFEVHLPHPDDPGSTVTFPPCPNRSKPLGMLDFKRHPFYANFVGYKRSISQEPAPAYLKLQVEEFNEQTDVTIHDLMRMSPQRIADFVKTVAVSNPDVAAQISKALEQVGARRIVSQAPPGV